MVRVFPIKIKWVEIFYKLCFSEFADKLLSYVVRSQFQGMSDRYKDTLKYLNMGFTVMFSIECTLKLIGCGKVTSGQGCLFYFSFLTCLQLSGIIIHFVTPPPQKKLNLKNYNFAWTKKMTPHIFRSLMFKKIVGGVIFGDLNFIAFASWAFKCWWNVWLFCIHL